MTQLTAPISSGELIDKLTILRLKLDHISDAQKRKNVLHEAQVLQQIADEHIPLDPVLMQLWQELFDINSKLWKIEDALREHEAENRFDAAFIDLARSVYITNDARARLKREINQKLGSDLIEEKSYAAQKP